MARLPLIVPTARAAVLAAAAAPIALVLAALAPGAWIAAPVIGAGLLLLIVATVPLAFLLGDQWSRARLKPPADESAATTSISSSSSAPSRRRRGTAAW